MAWTVPSLDSCTHQLGLHLNREITHVPLSNQPPVTDLVHTSGCLAVPDLAHLQSRHSLMGTVVMPVQSTLVQTLSKWVLQSIPA